MEARLHPFAGGVVKNTLVSDPRKGRARINRQRLPWLQSVFQLLGKHLRIACGFEGFLCNFAAHLVLAVPVGDSAHKCGHNNLRPRLPHRQHRVVEHAFVSPARKRFFLRLRESEIRFGAPQLRRAIIFVRRQQFVGAHQPHRIVGIGRHRVLPALAAGKRERRNASAHAARQIRHQRAILIVGVRHNVEHARRGAQTFQRLLQRCLAAILGQGKRGYCGLSGRKIHLRSGCLRAEPARNSSAKPNKPGQHRGQHRSMSFQGKKHGHLSVYNPVSASASCLQPTPSLPVQPLLSAASAFDPPFSSTCLR